MEHGSIVKQIHIDATPAVVYEVISLPSHIAQWWTDDADFEPHVGGTGTLTWAGRATNRPFIAHLTVVEAVPGERFAFRWLYPDGESATATNSLLVTFVLEERDGGTLLTVTEAGMREQGWEAAVLEEHYRSHDAGWTRHLDDLATYVTALERRPTA